MKFELKKAKEIALAIKSFNFTKYMLEKKEKKLHKSVELKEGLIDFYQNRIKVMNTNIEEFEKAIIEEQKAIKGLKTDIKKIVKVINLYIR